MRSTLRRPSVLRALPALVIAVTLGTCGGGSPSSPTPPPVVCAYTVAPAGEIPMTAPGGATVITVTTTAGCAWTAAADRDWIVITAGASGAGTGTVTVSVSVNTSADTRTGTLTVAGQAITIRQNGVVPCTWALSPEGVSVSHDDHAGSFEVRTAAGCPWTAASNAAWLTIRSGAQGTGNGTVTYAIDRNAGTSGRTGLIRAGDQTFTVTQAGDAGACQYSVGPVEFSPCMTSPAMTATVTTGEACTWSATPDASWITVINPIGGQTGSGSGSVTFQVADNWSPPRTGLVMVRWPTVTAGQNLRVMQAGCSYAVSTTAITIGSAGGTGRFDVLQQSDPIGCGGPLQNACLWTATSDASWITISTAMPQTGDNPVSFVVTANPGATPRTGAITVRDKVVHITQAGGEP